MTYVRRQILALLAVTLFSGILLFQPTQHVIGSSQATQAQEAPQRSREQRDAYRKATEEADQKIASEVQAHSELVKNLEYLTTQIGPRLTGSPQMQAASAWTLKRYQDYGIDAHLETAEIPHAWTRGLETAEIVSPIRQRVGIRAFGWSKGTNGDVSAEVMALDLRGDGLWREEAWVDRVMTVERRG